MAKITLEITLGKTGVLVFLRISRPDECPTSDDMMSVQKCTGMNY